MTRICLWLTTVFFAGVVTAADGQLPYKAFLATNNEHIGQLSAGMTKEQVTSVMGTYRSEVRNGPLANPYRSEAFQRGKDAYEVLYYLTHPHPPFTPIRDSQATPVVLKNGILVGWGPNALQGIK